MRQLIKRAEKAGYKAIVLTVDAPRLGRREADIKNRSWSIIYTQHDSLQINVFISAGVQYLNYIHFSGEKEPISSEVQYLNYTFFYMLH